MLRIPVAFAIVACSALSLQAAEVRLKLSGTAFEGGPAFEATLGGEVIASGTIDEPVPGGQDFTFEVPDDLLSGSGDLTLRLTNDYFAGEGEDRSLTVLGANIGGTELTPDDFLLVENDAPIERDRSSGVLIWTGNEIAVAPAPQGGWLGGGAVPRVEAQNPECSAYAEVVGIKSGSVALGLAGETLQHVVDVARSGACSVTLTGYADKSGSELANLRLTAARASAVLDALILAGARFPSANIVSTTGTDEFGPLAADNRRVTVQLWSPAVSQSEGQPDAIASGDDDAVARIARDAREANLAHLLVLGWRATGELYVRSSNTDPKEVLWLLEQAKARLIAGEPVPGAEQ